MRIGWRWVAALVAGIVGVAVIVFHQSALAEQSSVAPTISSVHYLSDGKPHGGVGVPGEFTFHPNGAPDVVGYNWDFGTAEVSARFVGVDQPSGTATVIFTPQHTGTQDLFARSVDRTGKVSHRATYRFVVG